MLPSLLSALARARSVPSKGWKVISGKQKPTYYKGKGAMKTGLHTSKGQFRILPAMLPAYVMPDLTGFTLKPYVANYSKEDVQRKPEQEQGAAAGAQAGGGSAASGGAQL